MTKNQELEVMKTAIQTLGNDSYLGPFLREQLPFFESAMRSDIMPTPLSEAHRMATQIVQDALASAKQIESNAAARAEQIVNAARNESQQIRLRLRQALTDAANKL